MCFVKFEEFDGYEKAAEKFKNCLCTFNISSDPKDSFQNTILFGLVFKLSKKSVINKEIIEQVLGKKFFMISQEKKLLQLEVSFCNFEKITLCSK